MKNMEKKYQVPDDIFRQGLSDLEIEPSEKGRTAFLEKAGRELTGRSRRTTWIAGGSIILGIALLTGGFLAFLNTGKKQELNSSAITYANINQDITQKQNKNSSALIGQPHHKEYATLIKKESNDHVYIHPSFAVPPSQITPSSAVPPSYAITATGSSVISTASENAMVPIMDRTSLPENAQTETKPNPIGDSLAGKSVQNADSVSNPKATSQKNDVDLHRAGSVHNHTWNIQAGIYYTPEWIFNTLDNNKYVNNFG